MLFAGLRLACDLLCEDEMKPKNRKLQLATETVRVLIPQRLAHVHGGWSSAAATRCSTWGEESGCIPTNASACASNIAECA
jgi:hypothetical protein